MSIVRIIFTQSASDILAIPDHLLLVGQVNITGSKGRDYERSTCCRTNILDTYFGAGPILDAYFNLMARYTVKACMWSHGSEVEFTELVVRRGSQKYAV